ncbi:MAG: choice-of-anchor J domain-containing protein [Candidatus Zixiibacteriota bacterium]
MKQKKIIRFWSVLVMAAALWAIAVPLQAAVWDTTRVYTGTATLYDVAVGDKLMGASDDTVRVFTTESGTPYNVLLFTDISSAPPMNWRTDIVAVETGGSRGKAIGDPDRDGDNDLLYGRTSSPYQLKKVSWDGAAWVTELVSGFPSSIYDIAVGDADNDGDADDIVLTNSYHVFLAHWNGSSYDTTRLYYGTSSTYGTVYGVAIGDFDATYAGNEIVAVTYGECVLRIRWDGAAWITDVIYDHGVDIDLYDVAVGDFDADNPGEEIAINNGYGYATHGAVLELYGSGASWTLRALYTPSTAWGGSGEIAVGDFLAANSGEEIAVVSGSGSSYEARVVYGSGSNWYSEQMFSTGGSTYGVAIGNVNRHRSGLEVAITGNKNVFEAEELLLANNIATLSIDNPSDGVAFEGGTSVSIQATVQNTAVNTQSGVPVNLEISDGGSYTYTDVEYTGTLTQGQTEQITFSPDWIVPNSVAGYTVKVWTALSGDEYWPDDTLSISVSGYPQGYSIEGFEDTAFPPEDWTEVHTAGTGWFRTTSYPHTGSASARGSYTTGSHWLITPQLEVSAKGDELRYWIRRYYSGYSDDWFFVEVSTGTSDTSDFVAVDSFHTDYLTYDYEQRTVDLSSYARIKGLVYVAFHYQATGGPYVHVDDVLLPPIYVPPGDMATISIDDLPGMVQTGTSHTIKATVQNLGGDIASAGVPVKLRIEGPESYVYTDEEATTVDLATDETEQITFTPDWVAPEVLCNYTITVWTELSGDEMPENDTLSQVVNVYRAGGLAESFTETTFPPPGWTVYNFDGSPDAWARYTSYYHSEPACARIYYDLPNNDWLITPRLAAQDGDMLKFWWRVQSTAYEETVFVRVSTSEDVSDTTAYSIIHTIISNSTDWSLETVDLSAYDGQYIYIAWTYDNYNNYGFAIDDVTGPYFPTQIAVSPDSVYEESWPDSFFDVFMYIGNVGGGQLDYSIELESAVGWLSVDPTSGSALGGEEDTITLSFNTTGMDGHYYNTVRIISNSGEKQDGDTVEVPIHIWVRLVPGMAVSPDSFAVEVPADGTEDEEMYVQNIGSGQLDYEIETEEWGKSDATYMGEPAYPRLEEYHSKFTDKIPEKGAREFNYGTSPSKGMGGPDAFGYRWIDSDEPGGPTFNWVEINTTGTQVSPSDDGNVGPFDIGFTFEFYGVEFTQFRIASNGFASFTSTSGTLSNQVIPYSSEPNNLLALMWDDLRPASGGGSGNIYYHSDGSRLVIEYDHVMRYGTTYYYTMQIILYPNGKIIYQYLTMDGDRLDESTIGIENAAGDDGLQVVYNANYVHDNLAIRFSAAPSWIVYDPESGSVPVGETDTVDVTFDATGILSGDFYGALIVSGNDPDNPVDTVPAHMTVLAPDMTLSPDSIVSTGTEGAVHHEYVTLGNTGPGDLEWSIDETIDWLSASPSSGTVPSGGGPTTVDLTIDCSSLYAGDYYGELTINNNDPDLYPSITYKVFLHVGPDPSIAVDPDSFYVEVYAGTYKDSTLRLTNDGAGHLVFDIEIEESGIKQSLSEGFEGAWPPSGWTLIQTHTGTGQPIFSYWTQTDYEVHSGSWAAGLWWDYGHQDEWMITPPIGISGTCSLTFWTRGFEGSTYGDHYYVKVSTDGGSNWNVEFDLSTLTLGDWNMWDYPYSIDLSAYSGQTVNIAFHAEDPPDNDGLWYIWIVDDIELTCTGGGWLTVNPEEGVVDPSTYTDLNVRFDASEVLGGEKFGSIIINHNVPEAKGQTTVPVHMVILGSEYSIDPTSLTISATEGATTDDYLTVGNYTGQAPLIYQMSDDVDWLSESPSSGTVPAGNDQVVTVTVDGTLLIPGDYYAEIYVETNDFDETYDTIPVNVHVGPDPVLRVKPESFIVDMFPGTIKDSLMTLVNDGDGTLSWEISIEYTTPVGAPGEPDIYDFLKEYESRSGAAPSGAGSDDPLVDKSSPMHLTRTVPGDAGPSLSPLVGKGDDTLFVQLPHDEGDSWSFATTDQGAGYKLYENFWGLTEVITEIDWWGLALIHTGTEWIAGNPNNLVFDITFYSDPPDDPSMPPTEVYCTYTDVVPSTIIGTGQYYAGFEMWFFDGAEFASACDLTEGWVSIQSKSPGQGSDWLLWASAKTGDVYSYQEGSSTPDTPYDRAMILTGGGGDWLAISPESGLTSPHDSTDVDVTFDATALEGGTWFADIIIDHNAPGKGQTIVPVRLHLLGANFVMTPESLVVDMDEGQMVDELLYLSNPGGEGDLIFSMTDPVDWLSEHPDAGSVMPDGEEDVIVRVDGTDMIAGHYYTEITITTNDFDNLEVIVPVHVNVGPDPDIDVDPAYAAGVVPGCQYSVPMMIRNDSLGTLAFNVSIAQTPPMFTTGETDVHEALELLREAGSTDPDLTPEGAYRTVGAERLSIQQSGGTSEGLLLLASAGRTADILLVDDDGGLPGGTYYDVELIYTAALDAGGYVYDYYVVDWTDPLSDGPDLTTMQAYGAVIWFCGETWGYYGLDVLTSNDEVNLAAYLGGGGNLFLSAGDYLYANYPSAGAFSPGQFPYDYLHLASASQDVANDPYTAVGLAGSVAEGMQFDCLRFTDNPDVPLWPDDLVTQSSAAADVFDIGGAVPTIQYDSGTWRVVFTTTAFPGFVDGASRSTKAELMASIVDWLLGAGCPFSVTPESGLIDPESYGYLTLTFDGDAFEECVDETLACYLVITSNDPDEPQVTVEVSMWPGRGDVFDPFCLIELGDVVFLINYVLKGGPAPDPLCMGDCDPAHDGVVDLADVVYLVQFLYQGGMPPLAIPEARQPSTIKQLSPQTPAPTPRKLK